MILVDGVLGWFYQGNGAGLGSGFEGPLGTSKAPHVSKFVEFYKSVSFFYTELQKAYKLAQALF